jgi:hypothetical protein
MTSYYLKSKSDTERKLRQYILDTIESFRNNRNVSRRNVSRGYNPRSEPDYSSNEEEEEVYNPNESADLTTTGLRKGNTVLEYPYHGYYNPDEHKSAELTSGLIDGNTVLYDEDEDEDEDSDALSGLRVNTNHIDEDVRRSGANFVEKEKARGRITLLAKKAAKIAKREEKDTVAREKENSHLAKERARLEKASLEKKKRLEERARLERARLHREECLNLNFWKTDAFKKWLNDHNRLLKHYMSEGTLHNELKMWDPDAMHYDIGIWKYLIDENYMANLQLDYSKDNFTKLFRLYQENKGSTRYDQSDERKLLFIHMYLREAFFARYELRNIDFRKKLCLLADSRKLVWLTEHPCGSSYNYRISYIRTPEFYYIAPYHYYPSSYQSYEEKCLIFEVPQNPKLLEEEYKIATGYDNILHEMMAMILLARERNNSSTLTTEGFASKLLTLNSHQLEIIYNKLPRLLSTYGLL